MSKDFKKAIEQAEQLGKKADEKAVQKIDQNLSFMQRGPIAKIWDKVLFLWNSIKNSDLPKESIAKIIGALLYLVLPFDIVPDFIPGAGLIDDAAVIGFVYTVIKKLLGELYKKVESKSFEEIDQKLQITFYRMLLNAAITFILTVIYIVIKCMKPFGTYSTLIARLVLLGNGIWFLIRAGIYIHTYGKDIFGATKSIIRHKNIRTGIVNYVRTENKAIDRVYTVLHITSKFVSDVPAPDEIIDIFIKHYKKRGILMFAFIAVISATMFIAKIVV